MDSAESRRSILVGYARVFGVEISPEETALESGIDSLIGFLADIDELDLEGVAPAPIYDPSWPRVNEVRS
jgi:Asp-tRNA(Asn)/Glu-tRNA(Gln) amidotransferase C subunit